MHRLATLTAWWADRPGRNPKDDPEKIGVEDRREYLRDGLLNQAVARALVADIRKNLSVDWLSREPVRAKLRTRIRRLLAKFDYPPEEEREAVDLVIKQMETFANEWAPETP
jgi:hypothetical protein